MGICLSTSAADSLSRQVLRWSLNT